jgi:hypothetical protein
MTGIIGLWIVDSKSLKFSNLACREWGSSFDYNFLTYAFCLLHLVTTSVCCSFFST